MYFIPFPLKRNEESGETADSGTGGGKVRQEHGTSRYTRKEGRVTNEKNEGLSLTKAEQCEHQNIKTVMIYKPLKKEEISP